MKKLIAATALSIASIFFSTQAQATPEWTGEADWRYDTVCLDTPTNARLNPEFGNNVRATLANDTCGNTQYFDYGNGPIVYENGFFLVSFWFDEIEEWRRYWIYENQIDEFYPAAAKHRGSGRIDDDKDYRGTGR